jgi:hypothetical protein
MINPLTVVRDTVYGFVEDEALTRGAAIAFYTTTSIGPLLFILIAIAGVIYGQDAAKGAILSELGDTIGHDSANRAGRHGIIDVPPPRHQAATRRWPTNNATTWWWYITERKTKA